MGNDAAGSVHHERGACWYSPATGVNVRRCPVQARRATVMISGLVSVSGCLSQSPNCSSTINPASDRYEESESASRNLNVLRLTRGCSQFRLLKVVVNETTSPITGVSTWCAIRTTLPRCSILTALSGDQASHPRAVGLRVSNTKRPSSVRADRMAASDLCSCSSCTNTWICVSGHDDQVELAEPIY